MKRTIYLDNNATTRTRPEVVAAMLPLLGELYANASSVHDAGTEAAYHVEKAREQVATALGCQSSEVFFTSGGTESNNIALLAYGRILPEGRRHVITTAIEHHAALWPVEELERDGRIELTILGCDSTGRVTADAVREALRPDTGLVSVMYANNETGVIQPVDEIAAIAKAHGAYFHTDAVQAVGKLPINLQTFPADTLSLSAHKFYGPKGVGALFVRSGLKLTPLMHGGGQESRLRPGTYNTPGIAGLGEAIALACAEMDDVCPKVAALRDRLAGRLQEGVPGAAVNGDLTRALPNTLNIALPCVSAAEMVRRLSDRGVACSAGSACSAGTGVAASHVLVAMGLGLTRPMNSLRLSLGRETTEADIEAAARVIIEACGDSRPQ